MLPGIVLLTSAPPTPDQCIEAALLHGGPDAMITGLWAAHRYGLRKAPTPAEVHILVPAAREVASAGFVLVERTTRLPSSVRRDGTPLAPLHRAVLDGARRLRDFDAVRAMLAEPVQRRMCTPQVLADELERGSQRGSALPRRALAEIGEGAHSVAEADSLWLWKRAGLPPCARNVKVFDAHGRYVGTPDAWCDQVALAWEIDSRDYHQDPAGYARTLERNARYAAAGVVVLQTLPSRLRSQPKAVIEELRAAFAAARDRPRPNVRTAA